MTKGRLEAFSDGVIAILITIMVLELKVPEHEGADLHALAPLAPVFLAYVLSFVYLGIYWNNHHHMLHACTKVNGRVLWANLHLLFWLSLVPFVTHWMGRNHNAPLPTAVYGLRHAALRRGVPAAGEDADLAAWSDVAPGDRVRPRLERQTVVAALRIAIPAAFVASMDLGRDLCRRSR